MMVEVLSIGNELLMGKTVNTNASWIADRVTRLGGLIRRITVIGDDLDEIASALKEAALRGAKLIITTGGLGPTHDDKTMEGIARALNVPLELNEEALRMLEAKVRVRAPQVRKMAYLPRGAEPLQNPVGAAPGALVKLGEASIVALPGVPSEMKAMFELHVEPLIKEGVEEAFYEAEATLIGIYEADLAPIMEEVLKRDPTLYIKSHPKLEGGVSIIKLHVACRSLNLEKGKRKVEEALKHILGIAKAKGARVEES